MSYQPDFDLLSIGECLVEFSREPDGRFRAAWAGDAVNTLFYGARLGLRTGFISTFGEDLFTPTIREEIAQQGIDLSLTTQLPNKNNGLYVIQLDDVGEYNFHFWRESSAARETLLRLSEKELLEYCSRAEWLLLSGITLAVMKGSERLIPILQRLRDSGLKIAFDTNYRPALWERASHYQDAVRAIAPLVDLFLPSKSDLQKAWPDDDPVAVVRSLQVQHVAMKLGADGCLLLWDDIETLIPPPKPVRVVDATGAGDAFNAGFITGLVRQWTPIEAVNLGQKTAVHVLQTYGAIDMDFGRGDN